MTRNLSIGALARASGVNLETIRYYERIGLMPAPARTDGGHRVYEGEHERRLAFIRRSRELGFGIETIRTLLDLADNSERPCGAVQAIAARHLEEVRNKIADLARLERILAETVSRCAPDATGCAVLDMLGPTA
jgi:MerR family mercuric resistance operon transcriptional regulator